MFKGELNRAIQSHKLEHPSSIKKQGPIPVQRPTHAQWRARHHAAKEELPGSLSLKETQYADPQLSKL